MSAINYGTSDYITLGIKPYDYADFENDASFVKEAEAEIAEYGGTIEDCVSSYIDGCYEADYANIKAALNKYQLWYYRITIKPGYYEGFALDIESNYCVALDSWEDRREMNKEITQIKRLLLECAGLGLVACYPGWCTGYEDYNGTIKAIKAAIEEMRAEVKATPTWTQYERA